MHVEIKKRFVLLILALAMSLSFAFCAAADAAETGTAATQTGAAGAASILKQGTKYYLIDASTQRKVTGMGTGVHKFAGHNYYFIGKGGRVFVSSWIRVKAGTYYATEDGTLAEGFTVIDGDTYYFKPGKATMVTGWRKIGGSWYYFSREKKTKGRQQTGLTTVGKYTYYLAPKKNGARAVGWKKISGSMYYFDARGRMVKDGIYTVNGKKYYFDASGKRKSGLIIYNGGRYFFAPSMKTGWKKRSGQKYYFSSSGKAVTGWLNLNGKKYYFNASGMMVTGWLTLGSDQYYFDKKTGAMFTGKHTIDGVNYDFGTNGRVKLTGAYSIKINLSTCVVTVYRGSTPVKAMRCSPGLNGATPTGTFYLGVKRHWHELFGGVWGQYTTQITGNVLFHSVFYYTYRDTHSLATGEFEKLGSPASHGCVRLDCADAYYIYHNCPSGTKCTIFYGSSADDPLGKPAQIHLNGKNYDPTDPIPDD